VCVRVCVCVLLSHSISPYIVHGGKCVCVRVCARVPKPYTLHSVSPYISTAESASRMRGGGHPPSRHRVSPYPVHALVTTRCHEPCLDIPRSLHTLLTRFTRGHAAYACLIRGNAACALLIRGNAACARRLQDRAHHARRAVDSDGGGRGTLRRGMDGERGSDRGWMVRDSEGSRRRGGGALRMALFVFVCPPTLLCDVS
jgi:hypothetical protein